MTSLSSWSPPSAIAAVDATDQQPRSTVRFGTPVSTNSVAPLCPSQVVPPGIVSILFDNACIAAAIMSSVHKSGGSRTEMLRILRREQHFDNDLLGRRVYAGGDAGHMAVAGQKDHELTRLKGN